METIESIKQFVTTPTVLAFLGILFTIFEITPIKISPWTTFFRWIGRLLNGELLNKIEQLDSKIEQVEENISTIKKDQEEETADSMRHRILEFASSCRRHEHHDTEEWNFIISQIKKYETYVDERHIDNGVFEENAVYLRELYHERLVKNDFD